jgi:hypothetical protein
MQDKRDVELTFLKKANENYALLASPNRSEQGEKRERTTSDDNDVHYVSSGASKRSGSTQRKSSTNTNLLPAATTTMDKNNPCLRMEYLVNQSSNKNQVTNINGSGTSKFTINKNAIAYAINQSLPPIKFSCEPKIDSQKEGANIIKELFRLIDEEFKRINPKHNDIIGFDSWYIDRKGDICGITGDMEIFIYLCEDKHVPNLLLNTKVSLILPKNLPPQRSLIIKGVSNSIDLGDMKLEITKKYTSAYYIDEIPGTNNGKTRYLRMDLLKLDEYKQLLNAGILCYEGQCLHVFEYLAAPRVLFCSMCNLPGHTKRQCNLSFERCKRCGDKRTEGEHKECSIVCHNCKGNHVSTDFKCPAVHSYRQDLIQHLRQHPEALPDNIQIFIPSRFRQQGGNILGNRRIINKNDEYPTKSKNPTTNDVWPLLPNDKNESNNYWKYTKNYSSDSTNVHECLTRFEKECAEAKHEYDKKVNDMKTKINLCLNQVQALMNCFSSTIQRQNEMLYVLKTSVNECLEMIKISNQAICVMMDKTGEQQYVEMIKQISAIPIDDRQASINKFFSAYTPLVDEITMKIMNATEHLQIPNG